MASALIKRPMFRVSDIAYMAREPRELLFNYIQGARQYLHPFIAENMVAFQGAGSLTFGNNRLDSDFDCNIKMKDWNDQFEARRIFYGNIGKWRNNLEEYLKAFRDEHGLKIDMGAVDCDTEKYNIFVSLDDQVLHHRYSPYPEVFMADANGIVWAVDDKKAIDLKTFDPATDEAPPVANQHLKWNFMIHRWQRILLPNGEPATIVPYIGQRRAKWAEDPFVDEIAEWKKIYGTRFQGYQEVNGELIADR